MGRLALTKGEGEGEGLVERTFILYDPSPPSSPLWRGEAGTALVERCLLCSRADSRQLTAERFDITDGDHLLDFLAEEKIKCPTRHDSQLLSQAVEASLDTLIARTTRR